jgi:hypothetical protein
MYKTSRSVITAADSMSSLLKVKEEEMGFILRDFSLFMSLRT